MNLSIKKKFLIPTLSASMACLAVITILSYVKSRSALEDTISAQVTYVSTAVEKQVGNWIQERENDLAGFSQEAVVLDAALGRGNNNAANARLKSVQEAAALYECIALALPDGRVAASAEPGHVGTVTIGDRAYFRDAVTGKTAISEVIKSKDSGQPVFVIATPVRHEGRIAGVLFGVVKMNAFARAFIDTEKVGKTGYVYMVDEKGLVIAYPDKTKLLSLDLSRFEFGRRILNQGTGLIEYNFDGVDKIVAFSREQKTGWTIASTANKDELFAPVYDIRNISIIIGAVGILVISAVLLLITRSIVNPINLVIRAWKKGLSRWRPPPARSHQPASPWQRGRPSRLLPWKRPLHPWRRWPP